MSAAFSGAGNKIKGFFSRKNSDAAATSSPAQSAGDNDSPKKSFWDRHKGKVVVGAAATGAVVGATLSGGKTVTRGIFSIAGSSSWLLLILTGMAHFANIGRGPVVISAFDGILLFYLFLGIAAALYFYRDPESPFVWKNMVKFLLLSFVAYAAPLFIQTYGGMLGFPKELISLLVIFTPIWPLYIFMNPGDRLTRLLSVIYLTFLTVYILISVVLPSVNNTGAQYTAVMLSPGELRAEFVKAFRTSWSTIKGAAQQTANTTTGVVTGNVRNVAPELFIGQVDKSDGPPLGVFFSETRPLFERFRVELGDSVTVFTTIRSRTLDENITYISHTCWLEMEDYRTVAAREKQIAKGEVYPEKTILTFSGEQQDINSLECRIPNNDLKLLNYNAPIVSPTVVFNSTFNFKTSGYITYAYMDRDLFTVYRADNRDPSREIGLTSNRPIARYTPGPVRIGILTDTIPFPFNPSDSNNPLPAFGVTFSSDQIGRGGINKFNSVNLHIPSQFELVISQNNQGRCTPDGAIIRKVSGNPMGTNYDTYSVTNLSTRTSENYITIRCPLKVASGRENDVLGPAGWSIYSFLVEADYIYSVDTRTSVSMEVNPTPLISRLGFSGNNVNFVNDPGACRTNSPSCAGKAGEPGSVCNCYYSQLTTSGTASQTLGVCSWPWGATPHEKYSEATCESSKITRFCYGNTNCNLETCTCGYTDQGKVFKCTWSAASPGTYTCQECPPKAADSTSPLSHICPN